MVEREAVLSEKQLIGLLILAAEGRPVRLVDCPPVLSVQGVIQSRIQEVLRLSEDDPEKREHGLISTTEGDRKLHLPYHIQCGEKDRISLLLPSTSPATRYVFGIHSHPGESTPPSEQDVINLLRGVDGSQAEFITMLAGEFLMLRTDQTPVFHHYQDLRRYAQQQKLQHELQLEQLIGKQCQELVDLISIKGNELDSVDKLHIYRLMKETERASNEVLVQQIVDLCHQLKIGLYYAPGTGVYQLIHHVRQLKEYFNRYLFWQHQATSSVEHANLPRVN